VSTATKERQILFSSEMVRAILAGRKTQTRRPLRIQPLEVLLPADRRAKSLEQVTRKWGGCRTWFALTERGETIAQNRGVAFRCKYGEVGSRLWVCETWQQIERNSRNCSEWAIVDVPFKGGRVIYAADCKEEPPKWRPSIHMPRWASRITLEITEVRVERVQAISEADAQREGVERLDLTSGTIEGVAPPFNRVHPMTSSYVDAFKATWNALYGKSEHAWDKNPWVWSISFRPLTPEAT